MKRMNEFLSYPSPTTCKNPIPYSPDWFDQPSLPVSQLKECVTCNEITKISFGEKRTKIQKASAIQAVKQKNEKEKKKSYHSGAQDLW